MERFLQYQLHKNTTLPLFYHYVLYSQHTSFGFAQQKKWSVSAAKLAEQIQACNVAGTVLLQACFQTYMLVLSQEGC